MVDTLAEMNADVDAFSEEEYEKFFKEFDLDGSGKIEKNEMSIFIRKLVGL